MKYFKILFVAIIFAIIVLTVWYQHLKTPRETFSYNKHLGNRVIDSKELLKLEEKVGKPKPRHKYLQGKQAENKPPPNKLPKVVNPETKNIFPVTKERNIGNKFLLKNDDQAEHYYYNLITQNTIKCNNNHRVGRSDDGGWDMCFDGKLTPQNGNCLSYSFGVNNIWEFDDEIATQYKCVVRTFDPSMTDMPMQFKRPSNVMFYRIGLGAEDSKWSNGWQVMTLSSLLKKFNESDRIIDILKIDIEHSEWESLETMLKSGVLNKVRQFMFETHTEEQQGRTTLLDNFVRFIYIWNRIQDLGFRQWYNHWNHFGNYFSARTGQSRTCCFEHYLINTKLL